MDLTESLCKLAKTSNVEFAFCGKPMTHEEVFAETGLLPAIVQRADRLCSLCLGYGIGVSFVEAQDSVLGVQVQFDDITPDVLRLMYAYDVVLEIIKTASSSEQVSLDELMYD
jgi:intracellular multiplication protein IcmS